MVATSVPTAAVSTAAAAAHSSMMVGRLAALDRLASRPVGLQCGLQPHLVNAKDLTGVDNSPRSAADGVAVYGAQWSEQLRVMEYTADQGAFHTSRSSS